ncbi:hypothetical protein J3E64_002102 [Sphingobium sp. OAS761]|uniref:hypothetical protein n=1 Tax=Sphingobium sp. OAS761 TaxID=2817901 RepID=UPI00209CB0C1|nr:hypothetical protein [Sphingobium sp. OAS761]MCP1470414.1 hypothetical protein [Sphingobium sp. OAS761]
MMATSAGADGPMDIRPFAPPIQVDSVYTPRQHEQLMDLIRHHCPWPMVTKGRFQNVEQIAASTSGRIGSHISMDHFIVAQFRGWVASHGTCYFTELDVDPDNRDRWLMTTGDRVNAILHTDELRLMLHWNAEVYHDLDDLKLHSDHRDDLTHDMVAEIFMADLRRRGMAFDPPADPYRDMAFIGVLNDAYNLCRPQRYPPGTEPLSLRRQASAA